MSAGCSTATVAKGRKPRGSNVTAAAAARRRGHGAPSPQLRPQAEPITPQLTAAPPTGTQALQRGPHRDTSGSVVVVVEDAAAADAPAPAATGRQEGVACRGVRAGRHLFGDDPRLGGCRPRCRCRGVRPSAATPAGGWPPVQGATSGTAMGSRAEPCLAPAPRRDLGGGALCQWWHPLICSLRISRRFPRAGRVFGDEAARSPSRHSGGLISRGAPARCVRPAWWPSATTSSSMGGAASSSSVAGLARSCSPGCSPSALCPTASAWRRWSTTPVGAVGHRPAGPRARRARRRSHPRAAARRTASLSAACVVRRGCGGRGTRSALRGGLIDLLLVDGPPAYATGYGLARYPALPALHDRLAPGATVVLDDVERPGEQEVLRRWERETGLDFHRRAELAGVAVARISGDDPFSGRTRLSPPAG